MLLRTRLTASIIALSAIVAALIVAGFLTLQKVEASIESIVVNDVAQMRKIKIVADLFAVSIVDNVHKLRSGEFDWTKGQAELKHSLEESQRVWDEVGSAVEHPEERAILEQTNAAIAAARPALRRLEQIVAARDAEELEAFARTELYAAIDPISAHLSEMAEDQLLDAEATFADSYDFYMLVLAAMGATAVLSLGVVGYAGYVVFFAVSGRLTGLRDVLVAISDGQLDRDVPFAGRKDEIGQIARAAEVFRENGRQVRNNAQAEAARRAEQDALRRQMSAELAAGLGSVVSAAVAGDFTRRVEARFEDEQLNALAAEVNKLVATVEDGLEETSRVLGAIARQDLTVRMGGDWSGAFARLQADTNGVAENLTRVVAEMADMSATLRTATGEILAGANDLADRTTRQAAALEQTSASIDQFSQTLAASVVAAKEAGDQASTVSQMAEDGGVVMGQATDAMERISQSSSKVFSIIGLIDDIAFQTNLLALNASVEAARAGDAGKGFAVVAIEVRRLAQSAAQASADVKALVEQSAREVEGGTRLVGDAASRLNAVLRAVSDINASMERIARSGQEQSDTVSEVALAIRQLDEMTQHNAALVEETNAAIEQTEAQASQLDHIVDVFVTERKPARAKGVATPPAVAMGGAGNRSRLAAGAF